MATKPPTSMSQTWSNNRSLENILSDNREHMTRLFEPTNPMCSLGKPKRHVYPFKRGPPTRPGDAVPKRVDQISELGRPPATLFEMLHDTPRLTDYHLELQLTTSQSCGSWVTLVCGRVSSEWAPTFFRPISTRISCWDQGGETKRYQHCEIWHAETIQTIIVVPMCYCYIYNYIYIYKYIYIYCISIYRIYVYKSIYICIV